MVKEKYLINEAAKEVHVESHVLRYWEEELELPIKRNEQGHRIYTQEDIDRFIDIKNLKDQGLQLKAVKTLLDRVQSDDGGGEDMRAANPFAQKQLTKISKMGESKMTALKCADDAKWNERFASKKQEFAASEAVPTGEEERRSMSNMIQIKEMRSLDEVPDCAKETAVSEETKDQTMRLQYLFQKLIKEAGSDMTYKVGTMIEIPRAALTADDIAKEAEFFSFGTNDLTQMTFGFSRDDAGKFLASYYDRKIYESDPFSRLDQVGVGRLVKMACELGRQTRPEIKLGICGEQGGDPSTVEFCHDVGLTYVSCSPFRVPIARLAAAQAAIRNPRKK